MRRHERWMTVLALPGLFAMMGATECEYFSKVTVPAVDASPPVPFTRMFFFGEEQLSMFPIYETTDDPNAVFVIYPAAIDGGGVRELEVGQFIEVYCNEGNGVEFLLAPMRAQQSGSVGKSVSNGLFVYGDAIRLGDYARFCDDQGGVDEILYSWLIGATDFAGNHGSALGGQVSYAP